jgi:hypothetical protein
MQKGALHQKGLAPKMPSDAKIAILMQKCPDQV